MGEQLALIPGDLDPEPEALPRAVKAHHAVLRAPVEGFLPLVEDEFRAPIRSKRLRVSVPRILREGDRPQSLGSAGPTRKERELSNWDLWVLEAEGVKLGPPATFASCAPRGPCVHVGCRHHTYLEVDGPIVKLNFPHLEPQELKEPCSLRIAIRVAKRAERGPLGEVMTHGEASKVLNLTAERTRQIEGGVLRRLKRERGDLR